MSEGRYPNLFLAGAPKCGTTSLADWLSQHPDIFMPPVKEPVFFASDLTTANPRMPERAYLQLYRRWENSTYAIDASTHNFYSQVAARRIAETRPDARIIIMLRNPVEAAYSLFHQLRFNGSEELDDFGASLAAEEVRSARPAPLRRGYPETLLFTRVYDFRLNVGRYLDHFGKERVTVLLLDDLRDDPSGTFINLLRTLSLDPSPAKRMEFRVSNQAKTFRSRFLNDLAVYPPRWAGIAKPFLPREMRLRLRKFIGKANSVPSSYPPLDPALRGQLIDKFMAQILWLEDLLNRDLSHWRKIQVGAEA